jgi:hypothetical protein
MRVFGRRSLSFASRCVVHEDKIVWPHALRRLDEIWPGPGGEAPQAYAW